MLAQKFLVPLFPKSGSPLQHKERLQTWPRQSEGNEAKRDSTLRLLKTRYTNKYSYLSSHSIFDVGGNDRHPVFADESVTSGCDEDVVFEPDTAEVEVGV